MSVSKQVLSPAQVAADDNSAPLTVSGYQSYTVANWSNNAYDITNPNQSSQVVETVGPWQALTLPVEITTCPSIVLVVNAGMGLANPLSSYFAGGEQVILTLSAQSISTPVRQSLITQMAGVINATITDSTVTLDSKIVNAVLQENPGILFGSATQSVTNLAVGGSVTFPVSGPLGNYDGVQCIIVSGSGYTTYNCNATPYLSNGVIGAGAYVASSSAAGDTTTTQATGTTGSAIQSYQLFVNPAFTNSINVTVINNGSVAVTDTFTVYVFARMSAAIRMGGNIVTVAHVAGITDYATASYSYASVGLGGWTILVSNATNETIHVVPNFGWTHAGGFASAIGGPNYTVDTAYVSIVSGASQAFTNLPVGARNLNITVNWPTTPTSGSYEFEILEYAG